MLEIFLIHWKNTLKILLISIVFIIINGVVVFKKFKKHIIDNWRHYRHKPYIIPFSGFIKQIPGKNKLESTLHNFISVLWNIVKKFLLILVKPFYPFFALISKVFTYFKDIIDRFRKQFKIMRNFLFKMIENIMIRLQNVTATFTYFFLKMRDGLKKQVGLFKMLAWTIANAYYFMYSMMAGPVKQFGDFAENFGLAMSGFTLGFPGIALWLATVCFDPNTQIKLKNNIKKYIVELKLGDIISDGSIVIGKCMFDISTAIVPMFSYKGIIVSGDHIVEEDGKKLRVQYSEFSKPILYEKDTLICLITNTGIININNIKFGDYLDTHNLNVNLDVHRTVELFLNNYKHNINTNRCLDLMWGFSENNIVFSNNKYIKLRDIKIGDTINNKKILAVINIDNNSITEYKYYYKKNKYIVVSGNQLVKENKIWIRASQSKFSVKTKTSDNFINFITEDNKIILNNIEFRDFMETKDIFTNNIIDEIVDESI